MEGTATPAQVKEELELLAANRTRLLENPDGPQHTDADVVRDLIRLRDEYRTAKGDDKAALSQQLEHLSALRDQIQKGRRDGVVDPDNPYFGHLRVREDGRNRDVFLGKATRLTNGLRIVDWRHAPISKLFYRYVEGDEYEEEFGGSTRHGRIEARRTVHIHQGELLRVGTDNGAFVRQDAGWRIVPPEATRLAGGEGRAMRSGRTDDAALGSGARHRADKHLPDIAALIDADQFELITAADSGAVVLRGSAGSGKTTVALHRIAYLAYAHPDRFRPERMMVMVWGRALRDYVAHVLPALGVSDVHVTTWESWARKAMLRHFPSLPRQVSDDTPEPVTRVKLHAGVADALATHIARTPGPPSLAQAIDDWGHVITDRSVIARAMGETITAGALERALAWTTEQQAAVQRWVDGDHEADARLDAEDDALLLRAYQLRVGPLLADRKKPLRIAHLVLDEVQDFSPVEVRVLLDTCDRHRSVTLAGDTRQHISEHAGFTSWKEFLDRIGVESTALNTLQVSYRCTHQVTRFAVEVLGDDDEPLPTTLRDGPPVELFRFTDHGACVAFLGTELNRLLHKEPLANVAVLTPDRETSQTYFEGLQRADVPDLRLVSNQRFAFAPGVDVVEASEVKGLEFDYVVIVEASAFCWPDDEHHRRLMHVAATRAIHQLWLTSVETPSPILPATVS